MDRWATVWGILGVAALLTSAVVRIAAKALTLPVAELSVAQWLVLALILGVMGWGKGYHVLQRRYVPAVLDRARGLSDEPRLWVRLLAPAAAMGLVAVSTATVARKVAMLAMIAGLVVVVAHAPTPWREELDAGVVFGLAWGLVALLWGLPGALSR